MEGSATRAGGAAPRRRTLYPPHRLDVSLAHLARAAAGCGRGGEREAAAALEALWDPSGEALACLSVRSGFDLLLGALQLPAGSEVLASALNIDDMGALVEAHGLRLVPIDVYPDSLAPRLDEVERALTSRARVLLVAQLFGGRNDLAEVARLARARGVLLVEDAAQAFAGLPDRPSPGVDVSMCSFGTLKTATALGGALLRVRDQALRERMRAAQAAWPLQARGAYLARLARAAFLVGVQSPRVYTALDALGRALGTPLDATVRRLTRGFPTRDPAQLLAGLRRRPCPALLRLLAHRLRTFDAGRLRRRAEAGARVAGALGARRVGASLERPTWWLLPASPPDSAELRRRLRAAGFETSDASNIVAFGGVEAGRLIDGLLYLPAYPEMGEHGLSELCRVLAEPSVPAP